MRFEEALKQIRKGKKVKRPNQYYLFLDDTFLTNEVGHDELLITKEDINAHDWEVVKEKENLLPNIKGNVI